MLLRDIGVDIEDALSCFTVGTQCCTPALTPFHGTGRGLWRFPDSTSKISTSTENSWYNSRGDRVILLHRNGATAPTGMFSCLIPGADNGAAQTIQIEISNSELHIN